MRPAGRNSFAGALSALATVSLATSGAQAQPVDSVNFSDGPTFDRWAHPAQRAPVMRLPSHSSRRIARTRYLTEDAFPEVYPVLGRLSDRHGRPWLKIRVPLRPRARTGWVREWALGPVYPVTTRLVVDRRRLRAALYRSGLRIWRSPVGVGKPGTPTPAGHFWIREKLEVSDSRGPYGPRAFGTSAYSRLSDWPGGGVIGIHGTDEPGLIPGRPSHGCIRVPNRQIRRLYRLMPIGTPIRVR